jgi:hypothetical protein
VTKSLGKEVFIECKLKVVTGLRHLRVRVYG